LFALLVIKTKAAIPNPKPYKAINIGKKVIIAGSIPLPILNPNNSHTIKATVKAFTVVMNKEKTDLPIS